MDRNTAMNQIYNINYGGANMKSNFKQSLNAIDGSINKWKRIVHFLGQDKGCNNCSLCIEYVDSDSIACVNCPIYLYSGYDYCSNSPYMIWSEDYHDNNDGRAITREEIACANMMLSFLYEVRLFWINNYYPKV